MTRLIKWLLILCFLLGILLGVLVANGVEKTAHIAAPAELSAKEIKRVQHFIKTNNPLHVKSGEMVIKEINQTDLDVLLNYITLKTASGINRQVRVKIDLQHHLARVGLSIKVPDTPLGEYLNLSASISPDERKVVQLESLNAGKLRIPVFLVRLFSGSIEKQVLKRYPEYALIKESIKKVSFEKDKLVTTYVWSAKADRMIKTQIGLRMLTDELKQTLLVHSEYLAKKSYEFPKKTSLNYMINTMFSFAKQRSDKQELENGIKHNPVIENKAAFIALGAYILKRDIATMLGKPSKKDVKFKRVYLKGKHDLSKHFILSAAIASMADSEVAESMGVVKEVRDAKNGSGFSFRDLAADHAGIKLVREVLESEEKARKYQIILANVKTESDYMLDVTNLPDGLEQKQFEKNYEDIESEAYLEIEKIIKDRINELPIYQIVD